MLGQLLHSINPARRAAPRQDSQIEDVHTKGLLFPDVSSFREADALSSPAAATSEPPDCHLQSDLDLDANRDVRILIAQGETLAFQPQLLFDSKYDPSLDPPKQPRHVRTGSRGESLASNHTRTSSGPPRQYGKLPQITPIPETTGRETPSLTSPVTATSTPQRSRLRRSSLPGSAAHENGPSPRFRETDEIVNTALNCMFENVQTTYRGISNKIKIVQREAKPYDSTICRDNFGNQFASLQPKPAGSTVRRPSGLSSSFTASDSFSDAPRQNVAIEDNYQTEESRRTVLITRTFSVKWSDDDAVASDPSDAEHSAGETKPVPAATDLADQTSTLPKPRRLPGNTAPKPPMFAITLVLSLPVSHVQASRPGSRSGGFRRKGSDMQSDWNSLASSFDSNMVMDPLFGLESSVASLSSDVDDRVDKVIGQHWDIIVRTLSSLQAVAEKKILDLLRSSTHRGRAPKLLSYALATETTIKKAATQASIRVVRGIRILRVRTGQGRWGVWRDEARWLNKWALEKEKTAFLFNLCTAFLGTHTEWLDVAGPRYYRHQHREQLRMGNLSEPAVLQRTIIVSNDKMVARRLVFLLSAFLPGNQHLPGDASPMRPSTSASIRAFSQSPPTHMPLSREESLRRTINRRTKRNTSQHKSHGSRIPQLPGTPSDGDDRTETGTVRSIARPTHSRRNSAELHSLMDTKLTVLSLDPAMRKSSATASPTVDPGSQMTAPYVAFQRKYSSGQDGMPRPNSQDSLASENLLQNLQRSNTGNSIESQPASRWGSLRSLWSMGARRDSATTYSDASQADDEGLGIIGVQRTDSYGKLHQMVNEAEADRARARKIIQGRVPSTPSTPTLRSPELEVPASISASTQPIDVPLKMSVNEDDGVIDVEFPGFSPVASPPVAGFHSSASYVAHGPLQNLASNMQRDTGHAMNVAGWLRVGIHPDFELQATPLYTELIEDVKSAMRGEPTPDSRGILPDDESKEEWIDVCTSIIADTTNFNIRRIKLRRLVKYLPPQPPPVVTPMVLPRVKSKVHFSARSQYGNPYDEALNQSPTQIVVREDFEDEKVLDADRALMDALERVIAHSGPPSKAGSTTSSRAGSVRGRPSHSSSLNNDELMPPEVPTSHCKRMVIGALEQIATAVERERRDARKYGGARLRGLNGDVEEGVLREGIAKWFDEVEANKRARDGHLGKEQGDGDDAASMLTLRPSRRARYDKLAAQGNDGVKAATYTNDPSST